MTVVLDLMSGTVQIFDTAAKEAVIAAFAQSRGDNSTWLYAERYGDQVVDTGRCYTLGDFTAIKELKCPNCDEDLVKHTNAGRRQYKEYPNLLTCPKCWHKYNPVSGEVPGTIELTRISNKGKRMKEYP